MTIRLEAFLAAAAFTAFNFISQSGRISSTDVNAVPTAAEAQTHGRPAAQQGVASTTYPWSSVVLVLATFPNGFIGTGSGVMVGRNDVLTAAHVVFRPAWGGAATFVEVLPAAVNGLGRVPRTVAEATANGIYLIADNRLKKALFPGLSVEENLMTGSLRQTSRYGFMRGGEMLGAARDIITRLAVKCAGPTQDVMQLSGGNQQKLAFGRWLVRMDREAAKTPPLLLLDNPTEGVDVGSKAELYGLIRRFAAEGAAVLIASAEFGELLKLCDRIHCIADDNDSLTTLVLPLHAWR